ncbi:MAG: SCO family protein [Bacteroidetes bacterium]|nr:SCO family protein [Bacteroidota bacterium]
MVNGKRKITMAAIAAIVILPIIGILMLADAKWVHQELPYLGNTIDNPDGSKEYHTLSDINLINQHGKQISLSDFDSCILVVNIFFTSCPEVCPAMNKQIQVVAEEFRAFPNVRFLSISIDPENDSVPVLAKYAQEYRADLYKRTFATGNKKLIYDWVLNDLLLANEQRGSNFIHDDKVVIVDKALHIRSILATQGVRYTQKLERVKHIQDDINNLLYEYRKKDMDKR